MDQLQRHICDRARHFCTDDPLSQCGKPRPMQEAHGVGQPALGSRRPFPPVDCSRFERLHELRHDALKRRIAENAHAATPTVLYYSAGWQVVEEREDGIPTAQYVWSPVYVDAMILRDRDANANPADGLEQRHYVQHDANFNVTAITDPTGTVVERYLYDPYGQATVLAANWQPTTANHAWQYLHQGGRYDPATNLHHFRSRDYSAELGRFSSGHLSRFSATVTEMLVLRSSLELLFRFVGLDTQ